MTDVLTLVYYHMFNSVRIRGIYLFFERNIHSSTKAMELKNLETIKDDNKLRQSVAVERARKAHHCYSAARAALMVALVWTFGIPIDARMVGGGGTSLKSVLFACFLRD